MNTNTNTKPTIAINQNNFLSKLKKLNSLLNANDILELNSQITRDYSIKEEKEDIYEIKKEAATTTTTTTTTTTSTSPISDLKSSNNGTNKPVTRSNNKTHKKRTINKKVTRKMPKIKKWIPFTREYVHQFSRFNQSYRDSLLYMSSQFDQIDCNYTDEVFLEDQSELSKLHYLSETIGKYRQIFGFPQHDPLKPRPVSTNKELTKLKSNLIKSTNLKSKFVDHNYLLKSGTVERPYLSIRARQALVKDNLYGTFKQHHYPITAIELSIIISSGVKISSPPLPNGQSVFVKLCRELPGRVPIDIIRYLIDQKEIKKDSRLKLIDQELSGNKPLTTITNIIDPFERDVNNNKRLDKDTKEAQLKLKQAQQHDINDKALQRMFMLNELGRYNGDLYKSANENSNSNKNNNDFSGGGTSNIGGLRNKFITPLMVKSNQKKIVKSMAKDFVQFTQNSQSGDNILDVKFDPTGRSSKILTLSKGENNAFLYDWKDQTIQNLKFHSKQCNEGHFSIDGTKVVTASKDGTIATWSTETASILGFFEHENHSPCLRLALHRYLGLAIGGFLDKTIYLYNYESQDYVNVNTNYQDLSSWPCAVTDLSFGYGKNSDKIAGGIGSTTDEPVSGFVSVIDVNKPSRYINLYVQEKDVSSVAWNPRNHDVLASASNDINQSICVYDLRAVVRAATIKTGQVDVNICTYSPCANYITLSGTVNTTFVFDIRNSKKPLHELKHKIHDSSFNPVSKIVTHAQWSKNGEFFATAADDGCVRLWDIQSSEPLIKALEHKPYPGTPINFFDISPNSDMVVCGGDDGCFSLFSTCRD